MKVILSRKGFDSGTGGYASPIMPDGTLLSLPIPDSFSAVKYTDINYNGSSYHTIMSSLKGDYLKKGGKKSVLTPNCTCHFDPDLMRNALPREEGWRGLFGQIDRVQSHLVNQGIEEGDLFLFFGWFRKTIVRNGELKFDPKDRFGRHIIYGYLQIDQIIRADSEKKLEKWIMHHPHALASRLSRFNNTIYISKESLTFIDNNPGFGVFKYASHRVLTKAGEKNRSYWGLPEEFKSLTISCHKQSNWQDGYFKSNARGQEFVIQQNQMVRQWVKTLFRKG